MSKFDDMQSLYSGMNDVEVRCVYVLCTII